MSARAPSPARVLPDAGDFCPYEFPDAYARDCASFLASRLDSCSGVEYRESFEESAHVDGAWRGVESDYPDWYRAATKGEGKYDGANLRAALARMARGDAPNFAQREARWLVARIDGARTSGDRGMDLPAQEGRRDGSGGARRGVKQARLRVERRTSRTEGYADGYSRADGSSRTVERIPLRLPTSTMEQLRTEARAQGITVNALAGRILEAVLLGADPAEIARAWGADGSSPAVVTSNDEVPF